ncbi:sporulation protein [Rossellomorea marisflavi]|uniref:Sporulation protein n=1 Tax=Rossellomorea marisflavi TaxID=189381 RepID=A0A0M0GNW4_9BACI|nr:germination protein YpeB [Rossellomorea marisflavi]KON91529.1 sporulation protein [Rossellomorea marisflavi]MCM2590633.1 germination protein YpeB [Rossellomorea marisflavi]
MIRGIIIAVLVIGVAGTAFWGYQEHQEKNAILINAENNYQRAFHELTYQMDMLHDGIGATLAMNSRKSLSPALADVWRLTSQAHSDVGQLPLSLLPFNKTEEFLSQIGDFSYRTAVRDLDKNPLTDEEYKSLEKLYEQSAEIQDELRTVQNLVMKNNLRWMDVEMALASGKEQADNTIIDGFKTVEKNVTGYTEANVGTTTFVNNQKKENNFKKLKGKNITKDQAVALLRKYSGIGESKDARVEKSGKGSEFEFYSVSIGNGGTDASMDVTKKGGYPIWYINNRNVKDAVISLNEASRNASKFLNDNDFEQLELFESAQYNNIGVFTFVKTIDGVRIYPDSIKVKVALDNGQIVGFAADEYLRNHHDRETAEPTISIEKAKGYTSPNLKVMEERQAVIVNDLNEEVLCYEFLGMMGKDTFRIFINAQNGQEEKVERMKSTEQLY